MIGVASLGATFGTEAARPSEMPAAAMATRTMDAIQAFNFIAWSSRRMPNYDSY